MTESMRQKAERIKQLCLVQNSCDPIEIALTLMADPLIGMHGPEHHILDGSALLTALHHAGAELDLPAALDELAARGSQMPGATCGMWGMCGSAASVGAALAVWHGTGPVSNSEDYKNNLRLVARALTGIGEVGGPRCCKRNAFLSLLAAAEFVREHYGLSLKSTRPVCGFSARNAQCIGAACPFHAHSGACT